MSQPRLNQEVRAIRVLLLEDDDDDAELVEAQLVEGGLRCEIERVESRPTFRTALVRGDVDLVIADYSLPRFDAVAALDLVQQLRPDIPVVLLSGVIAEDLAIESLKLGATDYVLKQRLDRLVPVVLRALRESDARRRTLTEVRDAIRDVRACASALGGDPAALTTSGSQQAFSLLGDAIGRLEVLTSAALGEHPPEPHGSL